MLPQLTGARLDAIPLGLRVAGFFCQGIRGVLVNKIHKCRGYLKLQLLLNKNTTQPKPGNTVGKRKPKLEKQDSDHKDITEYSALPFTNK